MKKIALCLLGLQLALAPAYADVIPSKHEEKDAGAAQAVAERLQTLGLSVAGAQQRVNELSSESLAYFGQDPARIQPAAGLYWYEFLLGAAVLAGATIIYLTIQGDYNDQVGN